MSRQTGTQFINLEIVILDSPWSHQVGLIELPYEFSSVRLAERLSIHPFSGLTHYIFLIFCTKLSFNPIQDGWGGRCGQKGPLPVLPLQLLQT